jgi:ABC-type polysaccharide/polyol phosphate export permease
MMVVLTFVWTKIFPVTHDPKYDPAMALCGLVPLTFSLWRGLTELLPVVDNAPLIKRIPVPRDVLPIASVLDSSVHPSGQVAAPEYGPRFRTGINRHWLWLLWLLICELTFVCGCSFLGAG